MTWNGSSASSASNGKSRSNSVPSRADEVGPSGIRMGPTFGSMLSTVVIHRYPPFHVKPRVKGGRRLWTTDEKLRSVTDYRVHARNAAAMWEALSKGHGALLVGTEEVRIVAPSPYHALRAIVLDPEANRDKTVAAIVDTVLAESGLTRRVVEDASGRLE